MRGAAAAVLRQPLDAVRYLHDRFERDVLHRPVERAPGVAELRAKFPDAGLPEVMVGTTIDRWVAARRSPTELMQTAAAAGFNTVRLGAYWDQIQPNGPDDADFTTLDALLDAARESQLKVVLTIGAKAPVWPEFHVPAWAEPARTRNGPDYASPTFVDNTLRFARLVAEHTRDRDEIVMWQAENEPSDDAGAEMRRLPAALIEREIDQLHEIDGRRRPVMLTNWSESDRHDEITHSFAHADAVGIDVYPAFPFDPIRGDYFGRTTGVPSQAIRDARRSGVSVLVGELQAEDWAPSRVDARGVEKLTHSLMDLGYHDVLFWGFGTAMDRRDQGDSSLLDVEAKLAAELKAAARNT